MKNSPIHAMLGVLILFLPPAHDSALNQGDGVEVILVGDEYHERDLPPEPVGSWFVLHGPSEGPVLELLDIVVTPFQSCGDEDPGETSGRAVSVPQARDPIMLVRGLRGLAGGPVRTAFVDRAGAGEAERIEITWDGQPLIVSHAADDPVGEQPGRHRVELTVGASHFQLHSDEWHGDGHWRVRWIGDLNRDDWPDLLLDASYKYSVYTTRLYLSSLADDSFNISEAARFEHSAC